MFLICFCYNLMVSFCSRIPMTDVTNRVKFVNDQNRKEDKKREGRAPFQSPRSKKIKSFFKFTDYSASADIKLPEDENIINKFYEFLPLHRAILTKDVASIISLMEGAENINDLDHDNNSPLHLFFKDSKLLAENQQILQLLMTKGVNLYQENNFGCLPIDYLNFNLNTELLESILKTFSSQRFDFNHVDGFGCRILDKALANNSIASIKFLLGQGVVFQFKAFDYISNVEKIVKSGFKGDLEILISPKAKDSFIRAKDFERKIVEEFFSLRGTKASTAWLITISGFMLGLTEDSIRFIVAENTDGTLLLLKQNGEVNQCFPVLKNMIKDFFIMEGDCFRPKTKFFLDSNFNVGLIDSIFEKNATKAQKIAAVNRFFEAFRKFGVTTLFFSDKESYNFNDGPMATLYK